MGGFILGKGMILVYSLGCSSEHDRASHINILNTQGIQVKWAV